MPDDPIRPLSDALGNVGDRVGDYTDVWKKAAANNAAETYNADALIADFLKLSSLVVRDMFAVATGAMNALGGLRESASSAPASAATSEPSTET